MSDQAIPPLGVTAVMLAELDFDEQIALCASLGVTHYCLRPRVIREDQRDKPYSNWGNHKFDLTPRRLIDEAATIRRKLTDAGLVPYATVPSSHAGVDDETLRLDFEGAAAVGARCVRTSTPPYPQEPFDYEEQLKHTIERYDQVLTLAEPYGVKLVVETHTGSLAASPALAWNLVRPFDPQRIGVIFDLPNFIREGMIRPTLAVAVLHRYIDHLHVGGGQRVTTGRDKHGFRTTDVPFTALEEADLHLPTWFKALRDAGVHAPLVIEDFTAGVSSEERLRRSVQAIQQAYGAIHGA